MAGENSLPERILDATEEVLRRHGVEKANVVDVARVLGMSHANIYRYFPSKKALLDAMAARWLHALTVPLETIANDRSRPAATRLEEWFNSVRAAKRLRLLSDPELFRVYHSITSDAREIVGEHVATLLDQVARIITDGVASREFSVGLEPGNTARAFLQATTPFHHPALLIQGPLPTDADAKAVFDLLLAGLRAGQG